MSVLLPAPLLLNLRHLVWCDDGERFVPLLCNLFVPPILSLEQGCIPAPLSLINSTMSPPVELSLTFRRSM